MKKILLSCCLALCTLAAWAAKANPTPVTVTQSDGTLLTVYQYGDEHFSWVSTADGTLLTQVGMDFYVAEIGKDGTLKYRLKQAGPALRLKTGTLKDVRALAGYWLGDKPMIVVVVINSPNATNYLNDLDKLVSKIVQPGGDAWIDAKMKCAERMEA